MIRHNWNGTNKCTVCGLEKATYKTENEYGTIHWKIYYHRDGIVENNKGCIQKKINKPQLELW